MEERESVRVCSEGWTLKMAIVIMRANDGLHLYYVELVGPGEVPARGVVYRSAATNVMEGVAQMRWVPPPPPHCTVRGYVQGPHALWLCGALEAVLVMHYSSSVGVSH